MPRAEIDE
jgi:hypothetical protein